MPPFLLSFRDHEIEGKKIRENHGNSIHLSSAKHVQNNKYIDNNINTLPRFTRTTRTTNANCNKAVLFLSEFLDRFYQQIISMIKRLHHFNFHQHLSYILPKFRGSWELSTQKFNTIYIEYQHHSSYKIIKHKFRHNNQQNSLFDTQTIHNYELNSKLNFKKENNFTIQLSGVLIDM